MTEPAGRIRDRAAGRRVPRRHLLLYLALFLLYLLHNDLWLWDDTRLVLGLPVGLLFHAGYCVAASVMLFLLVRHAWPEALDHTPAAPERPEERRER